MARPPAHLRARSADRTRRLANHLLAARPRRPQPSGPTSAGHESGQDHLACYLHNGNEYLEAMLGAYKARVAPFNVNYRYVAEELRYLLTDSGATAIVFHSAFADRLAEVLPDLPRLAVLLQVDDGSGTTLLPGAVWYEEALAAASAEPPRRRAGAPTTSTSSTPAARPGCPRACCGARPTSSSGPWAAGASATGERVGRRLEEVVETAPQRRAPASCPPRRSCTAPATGWPSTPSPAATPICIQDDTVGFDAADVWRTIEREQANILLIVGDAFGRPLVDELERRPAPARPTTCRRCSWSSPAARR